MNNTTDTPRTDAASFSSRDPLELMKTSQQLEIELTHSLQNQVKTQTEVERLKTVKDYWANLWADLSHAAISDNVRLEKRAEKAEAEVERITGRMKEAEDLIKGLHDGWKKARVAHLETCKNAQTEIDKLYTENVCLQELIQEFYEWTRRDYPTEAEVREIMNRYHHILNK